MVTTERALRMLLRLQILQVRLALQGHDADVVRAVTAIADAAERLADEMGWRGAHD